ncbi:hypothetical protein ACJRO7_036026 [Eucalyptus globulus]|uniref:Uncharacterized protein n=1 Tax=Eucalyptus globulus TaxID=34317 RepID=A0ABD3J979_EUCGL
MGAAGLGVVGRFWRTSGAAAGRIERRGSTWLATWVADQRSRRSDGRQSRGLFGSVKLGSAAASVSSFGQSCRRQWLAMSRESVVNSRVQRRSGVSCCRDGVVLAEAQRVPGSLRPDCCGSSRTSVGLSEQLHGCGERR